MAFDRFLIAPINTGLETDLKSWLIPDDAFAKLNNAYVFRGRVRKRFGSKYTGSGAPDELTKPLYSRLGVNLGVTYAGTVPGAIFEIGQQFWVNGIILTVWQANGAMLTTNSAQATGTFDTASGAYNIAGAGVTGDLYWYPAQPVMGLSQIQVAAINDEPSLAFDTQFAYRFNTFWERQPTAGPWHGDDTNFFWTTNFQGSTVADDAVYVSNFQVTNPNGAGTATDDFIWRYNVQANTWVNMLGDGSGTLTNGIYFDPNGGAPYTGKFVVTARIILPFKNHLILLNTIENDGAGDRGAMPPTYGTNTHYPARCRYSAYNSVTQQNSWYEIDVQDSSGMVGIGAGFEDASTEEEIIGAEFIKDRLVVYFENSTWELVWTGNGVRPFVWQKINTELGSDATFSTVPFDREVYAIGTVGVHACNGSNVQRIDEKIPEEIFKINKQDESIVRVVGIRDYFTEVVYWTFPSVVADRYPDKILLYNYRNNTWAFNDDTITFFGYFEQQSDTTWADLDMTWAEANFSWDSGIISANFRQIIAGNQHGFVFTIDPNKSTNEKVMQITNVTQSGNSIRLIIIDHTLTTDDYISLANLQGVIIEDTQNPPNNPTIFKVNSVIDADTITIGNADYPLSLTLVPPATGYTGGGVAGRVSNIDILSKQWNPYVGKGRNFYLARIDFCIEKTTNGEVTVDYFPSGSNQSMLLAGGGGTQGTQANMSTGVLETRPYDPRYYPFEQVQERLWHPIYFGTDGQTVQIEISMSDTQIRDPLISEANFVLEGLVLHIQPTSYRLQ